MRSTVASAAMATARVAREPLRTGSRSGLMAELARQEGSVRVLVGLRDPRDLPRMQTMLERFGDRVSAIGGLAVLAVTTSSPQRLARALLRDRRVAYAEPSRLRRVHAEPADAVDPDTGIPFAWQHLAIRDREAVASIGGFSRFPIAVIDTGVDRQHPDIGPRVSRVFDAFKGEAEPGDPVGHGTFVAGLIGAVEGNGIGLSGASGRTTLLSARVGMADEIPAEAIARGVRWAIRSGARVINLSLGGDTLTETESRSLSDAFYADALPVASSGNEAQTGNPVLYPAAYVGGVRGRGGIGLSVGASRPDGSAAPFSTHNDFVSVVAPGAGSRGCKDGVYSTVPVGEVALWDGPDNCQRTFGTVGDGASRYAYGEGTSFAAPLVAAVASIAWGANPDLRSEQVADVVNLSARQAAGGGWNEFTGHGVVDALGAVEVARVYDTTAPAIKRVAAVKRGNRLRISVTPGEDVREPGHRRAGGVYSVVYGSSTRNGATRKLLGPSRRKTLRSSVSLPRRGRLFLRVLVCDANVNCRQSRRGPFRR